MEDFIEDIMKTNQAEVRWIRLMQRLNKLRLSEVPWQNLDLSFSQFEILRFVGQNPGCHLQDVAEGVGLTPPSISVSIRHLEKENWLERRNDPNDGRATCIYISGKTKNAFKTALKNQAKIINIFLKELSPKEQDQLQGLMEKAIQGMENHRKNNTEQP
jgi:DNA-binding MarR family transcriptional regulator